ETVTFAVGFPAAAFHADAARHVVSAKKTPRKWVAANADLLPVLVARSRGATPGWYRFVLAPGRRSPDQIARDVEEGAAFLPVQDPRLEPDRVSARTRPTPGEENCVRDALTEARLVLPDPRVVEGLAAVDEDAGVTRLAARLAERA